MSFTTAIAAATPMCTLYEITLADTTVKRWTSYYTAITYGGNSYSPAPGIMHSKRVRQIGTVSPSLEVYIAPDSSFIDWDTVHDDNILKNATISIYQTSVADPDSDDRTYFKGKYNGGLKDVMHGTLKFESKMASRKQVIPRLTFSQDCDKEFCGGGTPGCSLVLSTLKTTGAVEAGSTGTLINDATNLTEADDYYLGGYIEMTSGTYDGEKRGIRKYETGALTLETTLGGAPNVGDTYDAYPHCRGKYANCDNFGNSDEFFGFEYAPRDEDIYV